MTYLRKTREYVIEKILEDMEYDIFSLKPELDAINDDCYNGPDDIEYEISSENDDESIMTAKSLETQWIAGRLSYLFKSDESITSGEPESNKNFQSDSLFLTKSMKRGIIMKPSNSFLETVIKMDNIFCSYHPKVVFINYIILEILAIFLLNTFIMS